MLRTYYELTKPGLVWGNVITTLAGFLFASRLDVSWPLLFGTLVGAALVIASACVFNNIFDREADSKMPRTKNRALATGEVTIAKARAFAMLLSAGGFAVFFLAVGVLPGLIALVGSLVYVGFYTPLKYRSPLAVFMGSIAGACPIVIGYTAAANRLDTTALLLFIILALWQIPHFYAIALYRKSDYAAGGIPVLSLKRGTRAVYRYIDIFIILYIITASSLTYLGYTGITYLVIVGTSGAIWLGLALGGFRQPDDAAHARRIFFMSLVVMLSFAVALSFAPVLP